MREFWEQYCDTGEKHGFTLKNGTEFLGWVMEARDNAVLVMWAPSPFYAQATGTDEMSPPDEWISFTDIVLDSLSYWDDQMKSWRLYPSGAIYNPPEAKELEAEGQVSQSPKPWWKFW